MFVVKRDEYFRKDNIFEVDFDSEVCISMGCIHKKKYMTSHPSFILQTSISVQKSLKMGQNGPLYREICQIGSTLLSNNAASDVSEWFLEWFWCCELLCLRLLFIVPISFIRWCRPISFHYNQNLAPDRKKIPAPRENYPVPDPTRFLDPGPDRSPV